MRDTVIQSQTHISTQDHSFGVFDNRGRTVGAIIHIQQLEVAALERVNFQTFIDVECPANGVLFQWTPQATRGGGEFGACQHRRVCCTMEEVDAQIGKYLASAKKRAIKNFTNSGK
tara:strand:+ start:42 stop:389 length:348 start_codon:yes stop_codon:yes gene_type:complete